MVAASRARVGVEAVKKRLQGSAAERRYASVRAARLDGPDCAAPS
jgi:hypothetical protein